MEMKALVTAAACYAMLSLSDVGAQVPDDLTGRAGRAIEGYVAACAKGEASALNKVTTEDMRLEYALDEPGTFLSIDANSIASGCGPLLFAEARIANWSILPTADDSAVFVHYDMPEGRQLALVEMRGDRIARIVNYSGLPPVRLTRSSN